MTVIRKEVTEEGELIPYYQSILECGTQMDGSNSNVSIIWPVTVSHKIDESSPFYTLKPSKQLNTFLYQLKRIVLL